MDLEDMMDAENIESLELDKRTNTLSITEEDSEYEVSLTVDLIREFEKEAEKSSGDVFKVVEEWRY